MFAASTNVLYFGSCQLHVPLPRLHPCLPKSMFVCRSFGYSLCSWQKLRRSFMYDNLPAGLFDVCAKRCPPPQCLRSSYCAISTCVSRKTPAPFLCKLQRDSELIGPAIYPYLCVPCKDVSAYGPWQVRNASQDFAEHQFDVSDDQNVIWKARGSAAERLCAAATSKLRQNDVQSAARLAVQAWGQQIMNGTVCVGLRHAIEIQI